MVSLAELTLGHQRQHIVHIYSHTHIPNTQLHASHSSWHFYTVLSSWFMLHVNTWMQPYFWYKSNFNTFLATVKNKGAANVGINPKIPNEYFIYCKLISYEGDLSGVLWWYLFTFVKMFKHWFYCLKVLKP